MTTTVNNTVNSAAARTMNTIIEATALTKSFPITKREKELILKGIDFSVRPQEFVSIVDLPDPVNPHSFTAFPD
ncbi:hypothetical protein [Lawsonella clevelandensis]|uniref:hypothetical protein n=1 Tax=Lawsonella clevelandensis TaxID=1528099 RepID=UPI0027BA7715|nr:hypothetical protein [Lawsonella clevelandensis]